LIKKAKRERRKEENEGLTKDGGLTQETQKSKDSTNEEQRRCKI